MEKRGTDILEKVKIVGINKNKEWIGTIWSQLIDHSSLDAKIAKEAKHNSIE